LFLQNRKEEYAEIDQSARLLLGRMRRRSAGKEERVPVEWEKEARQLKERLEEAKRKDFFSKTPPAETSRCFREIENELITLRTGIPRSIEVPSRQRRDFRNRAWATREKIHVDRLGSAWLIKRFIDPDAKFVFAPESKLPADAVHFDVLGSEFSHHADNCTFETILKSFRIKDKALQQIAEIIHDIDLKDHKFARPEASGFDAMIRALSQSLESDESLLEQGTVFLDALYQYYSGKKLSVKDRQPQRRSGRKRRKNS
jgi:hypothetical protein